jgi:DNA polymerase-1
MNKQFLREETMDLPDLSQAEAIVYDCETDGLDWKTNKIVGHVVTWGEGSDETLYLPVRHEGGGNLDAEPVEKWVSSLLSNFNIKKIGHNFKFDMHMCKSHDLEINGPIECTQINQSLIDENQGAYNLEKCSTVMNVQVKKSKDMYEYLAQKFGGQPTYKQMEHFHKLEGNDPIGVSYAEGDGTSTWQVWKKQHDYIENDGLSLLHGIECRIIRILFNMERRGVPVNEEVLEKVRDAMSSKLEIVANMLPIGIEDVRSRPKLLELFTDTGNTNWPLTPKGNPSFTEGWLKTFGLGSSIIQARKITNMENSFINPLLERHLWQGRVHCTFNQLKMDDFGTVTGRLSSSDPNMQQVPKRDKILAPIFRSIFEAEKGTYWSANDYSQQEFRVFTDYTGAPMLVDGYRSEPPIDIHSSIAKMLDVERDPTAKRMNLGMVYGMGVPTLANSLGIPVPEAKEYRRRYDVMVPEAKEFLKKCEHWGRTRGYVRSKLGRRRRFPDLRAAYKAGNAVIQMSSADITKLKMVEVEEYFQSQGGDCTLRLQVHDELDWFVPYGCEEQDKRAKEIMESFGPDDVFQMNVPMAVDSETGINWEEASFGTNWLKD